MPNGTRDASGEPVQIRIHATEPPGDRTLHVAVQGRARSLELFGLHPGDTPAITWTLDCTATVAPAGVDIRGPHVQGRPGGRFIYLAWGTLAINGTFNMTRRAKLMLDAVPPDTLRTAVRSGCLTARLKLTDAKGEPVCAAVRPPRIDWSASAAG